MRFRKRKVHLQVGNFWRNFFAKYWHAQEVFGYITFDSTSADYHLHYIDERLSRFSSGPCTTVLIWYYCHCHRFLALVYFVFHVSHFMDVYSTLCFKSAWLIYLRWKVLFRLKSFLSPFWCPIMSFILDCKVCQTRKISDLNITTSSSTPT